MLNLRNLISIYTLFLFTVFMALTPIMICSAVLAFLMIKELDQKDKEKKKKSKNLLQNQFDDTNKSHKLIKLKEYGLLESIQFLNSVLLYLFFSCWHSFLWILSSDCPSSIPVLILPLVLLFSILPAIANLSKLSPYIMCPNQFFFWWVMLFFICLFSFISWSTSSLVFLSVHRIFSILLHTHVSNAYILLISVYLEGPGPRSI